MTDRYYYLGDEHVAVSDDVTLADVDIEQVDSREYDRAVVATATVTGPEDGIDVRREYEALPRHNDVVDRTDPNVDDELVDRPDEVHVHTTLADDGEYAGDEHETWRPEDPSVLGDPTAFRAACREHFRATAAEVYERATRE